ncbi:MAG: glycosyltransferase family 4 protein [Ferruginibacter sp.]
MKIVFVNWSWYATGGDWTYIENLKKLYELNGHEVIPFSTQNIKNIHSDYNDYFVKAYDFKELNKRKNFSNGIKVLRTSIISRDAITKFDHFFNDHSDIKIAHLHNIHHYITPVIVEQLHKRNIKIIWTLHDYKIICPENSFISNGKLCEKCITGDFYHCAVNLCKKKSFLASSLASFEAYYYHKKKTYNLVDFYLCPSEFLLKKFVQFGFSESKFCVAHSCYDIGIIDDFIIENTTDYLPVAKKKYVLYVGRLEEIKGVHTLIEAIADTGMQLKIVGAGAEEGKLKAMAKDCSNIEFLGFKNKAEVFALTKDSLFVVCPSICYENLPFSVVESFLFSKPVIGAEIGGIPELVIDGKTGLLFEPGNAAHLCEKMNYLWNNENVVAELGAAARQHAWNMVNFTTHWKKLQAVLDTLFK